MRYPFYCTLLFTCLANGIATPTVAQYFSKLYELDSAASGEWGFTVLPTANKNLMVLGVGYANNDASVHSHSLIIAENGFQLSSMLYKVDYGDTYIGTYGSSKRLQNNNIGSILGIAHPSNNALTNVSGYFAYMELDTNGHLVQQNSYSDTSNWYDVASSFEEMHNRDLMLVGSRYCLQSQCKASGFIIKTDSLGNMIWQKSITKVAGQGAIVNSIQALGGDTLLVGAVSYSSKQVTYRNQTQYYTKSDPWFILMDTAGNILYDTLLNVGFASMKRIVRDPLGGYFFWGQKDSFYAYSPLNSENLPGYIAHLDNNFKLDWIKDLALTQGYRHVSMVRLLADGSILALGSQLMINESRNYILKLDRRTGNTIWLQKLSDHGLLLNQLVDFVERPDKSIVMTGSARDTSLPAWHQNDVWVVGVDSNGCEMPGCSFVGVPAAPIPTAAEFRVWPNPSSGAFNVQCNEPGILNVYSIDGRKVFTSTIAKGRQAFILPVALPGGVYVLRYMPEGGGEGKVVKLMYQLR